MSLFRFICQPDDVLVHTQITTHFPIEKNTDKTNQRNANCNLWLGDFHFFFFQLLSLALALSLQLMFSLFFSFCSVLVMASPMEYQLDPFISSFTNFYCRVCINPLITSQSCQRAIGVQGRTAKRTASACQLTPHVHRTMLVHIFGMPISLWMNQEKSRKIK